MTNTTAAPELLSIVRDKAVRTPEMTAVSCPSGAAVSYAQLHANICRMALQIKQRGYGPFDVIAVITGGGIAAIELMLSCTQVAVCAPLSPDYTRHEYQRYFTELGTVAILLEAGTECHAREAALLLGLPVFDNQPSADGSNLAHAGGQVGSLAPVELPVGTALVLFSSGTTSTPKLIPLTHKNLLSSCRSISKTLRLTQQDACLGVLPLHHIHGLVATLLATLFSGGRFIAAQDQGVDRFFALLETHNPTWYSAVPTLHHAIVARATAATNERNTSKLRFIRSASAPLHADLLQKLESVFAAPVVEAYGMTEASHQISTNPLPPGRRKPGSVGLSDTTEVTLFDTEFKTPLPLGSSGEIAIRGNSVSPGYVGLGHDESTIDGWLLTGDIGHFDADGYLYITGRTKEMINRGGEKISPAEIDQVLLQHPDLDQVASYGIDHPTLGETVAAVAVLKTGAVGDVTDIHKFAADRLTGSKLPVFIEFVDSFPRTVTGKPQRHLIAERYPGKSSSASDSGASDLQQRLLEMLYEVIGSDTAGVDDNIFLLGCDSISAVRLTNRINAAMGTDCSLTLVFRLPTVRELAQYIASVSSSQGEGEVWLTDPVNVSHAGYGSQHHNQQNQVTSSVSTAQEQPADYPLSPAQQRLWFLDQLHAPTAMHNMPFCFSISGELQSDALTAALQVVVDRHQPLRTRIVTGSGLVPMNQVAEATLELSLISAEAGHHADRTQLIKLIQRQVRQPFDLRDALKIRAALISGNENGKTTTENESILIVTLHYIAMDGWSMGVFWRELSHAYNCHTGGVTVAFEDLPVQYSGWVERQLAELADSQLATQLYFWREKLKGAPPLLDLLGSGSRPATQRFDAAYFVFSISSDLTLQLRRLAQQQQTTLFATLLTVFKMLLCHHSGSVDLLVGSPIANRTLRDTEQLVGHIVDMLALRSDLAGEYSFTQLLHRISHTNQEAYQNQLVSFARLVDEIAPAPQLDTQPLVQVVFALQSASTNELELDGMQLIPIDRADYAGNGKTRFDLSFTAKESAAQLKFEMLYDRDLLAESTIKTMAEQFELLVESIVTEPDRIYTPNSLLPDTDTERRMRWIWSSLLAVETISRHDNFFALGGNSLLALQLLDRLGSEFSIDIPLRRVYEYQTLAGLSACIDQCRYAD